MGIKLIARSIAKKSFNFALVAHICISGHTFLHRPITSSSATEMPERR